MPAPAEFAQIIVIGLQAEIWLGLLLMTLLGPWRWPGDFPDGLAVLAVTALAIVLGVLVDRLADSAFTALRSGRRTKRMVARLGLLLEDSPKWMISMMRQRVMGSDDPRSRFIEYQRNRLRIARATAFNLVFLSVPAGLFMAIRTQLGAGVIVVTELLILIGAYFSLYATAKIGSAWFGVMSEAYREWAEDHPKEAESDVDPGSGRSSVDPRCFRVAAVCYRRPDSLLEFLVVKTTDGRFWTVPKGHVEHGEAAWEAAGREAREEAGVEGPVLESPFTRYRYPSSGRPCTEVTVEAYLLRVDRDGDPDPRERHREKEWVGAGEAKQLLASGRALRHALEHTRLIDEAQEEIARPGGPR